MLTRQILTTTGDSPDVLLGASHPEQEAKMGNVIEQLGGLPDRIKASAQRLRELEEQVRLEREQRNRLVVEAIDEAGIPQGRVAKHAGLSQPQVLRILAAASS